MSLPQTLSATTPLATDSPAFGDDHLRNIKQWLTDVFGLTDNTPYTAAAMTISTAGVVGIAQAGLNVKDLLIAKGTITSDVKILDLSVTWNAGGTTFTAMRINVTDSGSNAGSQFVDFQVAGSTKFAVQKSGLMQALSATLTANTNQIVMGTGTTGTISMAALGGARTWTMPDASGTVFTTNGGQTVTVGVWQGTVIGTAYGGTAIDTSASTGVPSIAAGTWSVAAQLAATKGGTGIGSYTQGDLLTASSATTLTTIAAVASGQVLTSNGTGTAPVYSASPTVSRVTLTNVGTGSPDMAVSGANGQFLNIKQVTELHTLSIASTSTTSITFPASSIGLGVVYRVTTAITGPASFDVGVTGAGTRYGQGVNIASGTTNVSPGTTNLSVYPAASAIVFAANGGAGPSFASGVVRITLYYADLTAPTS